MKKTYIIPKSLFVALDAEELIATSLGKDNTELDGNDNTGSGGNDNSQWTTHQSIWDYWKDNE